MIDACVVIAYPIIRVALRIVGFDDEHPVCGDCDLVGDWAVIRFDVVGGDFLSAPADAQVDAAC
jgi:hypothetical protein